MLQHAAIQHVDTSAQNDDLPPRSENEENRGSRIEKGYTGRKCGGRVCGGRVCVECESDGGPTALLLLLIKVSFYLCVMRLYLIATIYVAVPVLIMYLFQRYRFFSKIGTVLLAYTVGIVMALSGLTKMPQEQTAALSTLQEWMMNLTVPIAIPLMLFSSHFVLWFKTLKDYGNIGSRDCVNFSIRYISVPVVPQQQYSGIVEILRLARRHVYGRHLKLCVT